MEFFGNRPNPPVYELPNVVITSPTHNVVKSDKNKLLLADASGGTLTINLLDVTKVVRGFSLVIKKTDSSSNKVVINGFSTQTIDGQLTLEIEDQFDTVVISATASGWAQI